MKIYNTLSRKKESVLGKKLKLFVCGPTVYDFSHIGHARTYIAFDAFVRYLRSKKHEVFYLQNITDIDDKIIQRAEEANTNSRALAKSFELEYLKDMKSLAVFSVTKYARATDYIEEIINQVQRLLQKRYAYEIPNDGIYFDVLKFHHYGELSRRKAVHAEDAVSRIDESVQKRNKGDFALWKLSKPGEPKWKSPWGEGRPGWHIEDTAITEALFGTQYDIHGGARDLIFPHHDAEIAQMEALSGKHPLAKLWMHTGFLTVKNEKMSKSLGNFITIRDFLKKHPARALRLLVLKALYRSPLDYAQKSMAQVNQELSRIDEFVGKLQAKRFSRKASKVNVARFEVQFQKALEDDFNTPKAVSTLFLLVRKANPFLEQGLLSQKDAREILAFLKAADEIFAFIFWGKKNHRGIPVEVKKLVETREKHRKSKEWKEADEARKRIEQKGWILDDTPSGPRLKRKA